MPLIPNEVQAKFLTTLRLPEEEFRSNRRIILKARQFGFTTLICALFFLDTINNPNTSSVVVAHDEGTTKKIFRMVRRFWENLPADIRPTLSKDSEEGIELAGNDSSFYIQTAGKKTSGRGSTLNNLHCSEMAFWPTPEDTYRAIAEAVPDEGNIFVESTANGVGGFFYDEYHEGKKVGSAFSSHFYAWFENPLYSLPDIRSVPARPSEREEEAELAAKYGLSSQQLNWRRKKKRSPGMRGSMFQQEYPSNDIEAFVNSGFSVFSGEAVNSIEPKECIEVFPMPSELLALFGNELVIFEPPDPKGQYVVSVDASEGISKSGDHDNASVDVIDRLNWRQVAHLCAPIYPTMLANIVFMLGQMYNWAEVAIERNNHGHVVISWLTEHSPYPNLARGDDGKSGLLTTRKAKVQMIDNLKFVIEDGSLIVQSARTLKELNSFVKLPGGEMGAMKGTHDDCVMSLAVGAMTIRHSVSITTGAGYQPVMMGGGHQQDFGTFLSEMAGFAPL